MALLPVTLNLISPKRFKIQSFQVICYPSKKYPTIPFISGDHGFAIGMLIKLRFHLRKLGTYSGSPCSSLVPFKGRPEFFPRSPNHGQFRSIGTHCLSNEAISESGFCRYYFHIFYVQNELCKGQPIVNLKESIMIEMKSNLLRWTCVWVVVGEVCHAHQRKRGKEKCHFLMATFF